MNRGPKDGRASAQPASTGSRTRTVTRYSNSGDSSAEHRRKLEALFSGGRTSHATSRSRGPEERVFASPRKSLGRSPSEYRLRLERIRIAREDDEITEATNAFLSYHQLPDDLDILYKVLQHPKEKVVREALGQISSLIMQGRVGGTLLLEDRLRDLEQRTSEEATKSFIDGLRSQIERLKETS